MKKTDMTPAVTHLYILAVWKQTIIKKTIKIFQILLRAMKTIGDVMRNVEWDDQRSFSEELTLKPSQTC